MWVSWNPSMFRTVGSMMSGCSAIRKDWMVMSITSWPFSACIWIQPQSRWGMMSVWSFQMFSGPEMARFAFPMTTGSRIAETMGRISCISIRPWELVAV